MFQRLVLTIATAVGLTGVFVVYTLVMRPIVVIPVRPPQITEISQDSQEEMPEEYQRVAKTYLKRPGQKWAQDQEWAETAPQGLRADNAFIFTKDWRRDEANFKRVHFTKFAMVWLVTEADGKEEAYSIVSDSVQLEFDSEMDERKLKNPGRVVKARFEDNVHIGGPNGLEIVGRDFFFDESLLLLETWSPVRIKFMKHFAYAPRMQIKFLPGQGIPRLDRPHVSGIDFVKLIGGPNPREPDNFKVVLSTTIPRGKEGETVPAIVKCTGDLIYTVASNMVVLNEDVRGKIGKSPSSTFISANRLTIGLVPKPVVGDHVAQPGPGNALAAEGFQVPNTNLEFGRMLAEGLNGELVTITSDEQGVKAYMARMEYAVDTQVVAMVSANPTEVVRLYRGQSSLTAPRVDVQLGAGAKTTFESLLCLGKGEIQYFNEETRELEFRALWKHHLSLKKDEQPGLHVVELEDEARFLQKKRATGLLASQIRVWLANLNVNVDTSSPGSASSEKKQDSGPKPEPKRMVALGNVAMTSDRLQIIDAKELDVVIEDADERQAVRIAPKSRAELVPTEATAPFQTYSVRRQPVKQSIGAVASPSVKNRVVGFANVPAESDRDRGSEFDTLEESPAKPAGRSASSSPSSEKPINVRASRIVARMYRVPGNDNPQPKSIRCEGNVNITQDGESGKKALAVDGDVVDLKSQAVGQEVIHVLGKPAVIKAQNYRIEGRDINLDLAMNQARVIGAGVLALPIPANANLPGMGGAANPDLLVRWDKSMDFDGLQARFVRGIQANSGLMKLHCEQMTVEMVTRMSFRAISTPSSKSGKDANPELKTIRCEENVRFENTVRGPGNRVTGVYRGNVGDFLVNQVTGKIEAQGPGKIRVWERQNKTESASATQNIIQANSPLPAEVSLWDFTFFEFEGTMKGSFSPKDQASAPTSMVINDRVRVTRGPVEGPPQEVKSDKLPSMGVSIRCNQLKVVQNPKSKQNDRAFVELVGIGNTEVEGRVNKDQFQASGDEMNYDGANGNIKLRANGRRQALIRGIFNNNAQSMEFNPGFPTPKDRFIKINEATDGNAKQ